MTPWLAVFLTGCIGSSSCMDVGQAVAIRTLECTGNADLGFARAKSLRYHLQCTDEEDKKVVGGACLDQISELSCREVDEAGDDPDAWLERAPACSEAFSGSAPDLVEPPDPTDPTEPTGDTGTPTDPAPPLQDCGTGTFGCALHLPAPGDQALGTSLISSQGPLTIEAWVRSDNAMAPDLMGFVSYGYGGCNGTTLGVMNHLLTLVTDTFLPVGPDIVADTRWHHVAAVWDGVTWSLFVDGANYGGRPMCTDPSSGPLVVGALRDGTGTFVGQIDELRVWNLARTQAELEGAMGSPLTGSEAGLELYYDFDVAPTDGTIPNRAGAHSTLTLSGRAELSLNDL